MATMKIFVLVFLMVQCVMGANRPKCTFYGKFDDDSMNAFVCPGWVPKVKFYTKFLANSWQICGNTCNAYYAQPTGYYSCATWLWNKYNRECSLSEKYTMDLDPPPVKYQKNEAYYMGNMYDAYDKK